MKKKYLIVISIVVALLFVGFKVYQSKNETEVQYKVVLKLEIPKGEVNYIVDNELSTTNLKEYQEIRASITSDLSKEEYIELKKKLNISIDKIVKDLVDKINDKKDSLLKKVNKLEAKTKAEKKSKASIKEVLNKEYILSEDELENISLLVENYQNIKSQDSKIKALDEKIAKRISSEQQQASQSSTGTYVAPTNDNNYNSGSSSSNGSGSSNSGGSSSNGRPDWYNEGGMVCEDFDDGGSYDCLFW